VTFVKLSVEHILTDEQINEVVVGLIEYSKKLEKNTKVEQLENQSKPFFY